MSWRIETANPYELMRELPDAWAQTCFLRPPRDLPAPCLTEMFDEIHRVLRDDGTLWVAYPGRGNEPEHALCLEEGGWLRADTAATAARYPNAVAHGRVMLFSKQPKFYFDPRAPLHSAGHRHQEVCPIRPGSRGHALGARRVARRALCIPAPGAAEALSASVIKWCMLAGSAPRACSVCGTPWKRLPAALEQSERWRPGCSHTNGGGRCLVLEPFCGLGHVGEVAVHLRRHYLGVERNADTAARARRRLSNADRQEPTR